MTFQATLESKKDFYDIVIFKYKFSRALFFFILIVCSKAAYSDELDTLKFYGDVGNTYDNNLFKSDQRKSADEITKTVVGVKVDKPYSLQRFYFDVSYNDLSYKNNSFLSYSAVNYKGGIDWTLSSSLKGVISSSSSQSLANFAYFTNPLQDIQTNKTDQFRAEYSPHDIWAVIGGVTYTSLRNSQIFIAQNDFNYKGLDYGVRYKFSSGSMLTFLGHHRLGSYLKRPLDPVLLYDNGFIEDEYELDMLVLATGKSKLSSKFSYVTRNQNHYAERNYSDYQGFINYDLLLTGQIKTTLNFSRSVGYFLTSYSTYAVTNAGSINLDYYFSDKLTFGASYKIDQRNYKAPAIAGLPSRVDNENSFGLNATWQPRENFGVIFSGVQSKRSTTDSYSYFNYHDFTASITLDFKL